MNLENARNRIIEKVDNGDLSFNHLERFIIKQNRDIQAIIIKKMEDYSFFSQELWDAANKEGIFEEDLLIASPKFIFNLAMYEVEKGDLTNYEDYGAYIDSGDLERLTEALYNKLDNNSRISFGSNARIVLDYIIKNRRFDLIESSLEDGYLPYNYEPFKKFIDENISELSLSALINLKKTSFPISFNYYEVVLERIKGMDRIAPGINLDPLFNECPEANHDELFELLVSKGFVMMEYLLYKRENLEPYKEVIEQNIAGYKYYANTILMATQYKVRTENLDKLKSVGMFWPFIEAGNLDILAIGPLNILKEDIERIKEFIKSNPEKFINQIPNSQMPIEIALELLRIQDVPLSDINMNDNIVLYAELFAEKMLAGHTFQIPSTIAKFPSMLNYIIDSRKLEYITDYFSSYNFSFSSLNDVTVAKLFKLMSEDANQKHLAYSSLKNKILEDPDLMKFFLQDDIYTVKILEDIQHARDYEKYYTPELYKIVREYLSIKYGVRVENMDALVANYGPMLVHYIDNHAIQYILKLEEEQLKQFISIFPIGTFEMSDVEAIFDSLKQHEFSKKNPEILEMFNRINIAIIGDSNDVFNDFQTLAESFNEKLYQRFEAVYPGLGTTLRENPRDFFLFLKDKIKNGDDDEKKFHRDMLHMLTTHYVLAEREKWRKANPFDTFKYDKLPYTLDERDIDKIRVLATLKELLNNEKYSDQVIKFCEELGIDTSMLTKVYNMHAGNHSSFTVEEKREVSKLIGKVTKHVKTYLATNMDSTYIVDLEAMIGAITVDSEGYSSFNPINRNVPFERFMRISEIINGNIPKRHPYVKPNSSGIYPLLTALQLEVIQDKLLSNAGIMKILTGIMNKYKLHSCPDSLRELQDAEGVAILKDGFDGLAAFITYFYRIYEEEREKAIAAKRDPDDLTITIASLLKRAEAYGASSSIYSQILGSQDARLIKSNPGPNMATRKVNTRLDEAVGLTVKLFERSEITIPSFIHSISLEDGQQLNVTIGNFKNSGTLTLGERTGACMRIGGQGETLFDFCINDKNGFHIVLRDGAGNFVSRVSGFRNGNTVFLNQLRNSCVETITDVNIIAAMREVGSEIIRLSSESPAPICNVVVDKSYAMDSEKENAIDFAIKNNKEGLRPFYTDVGTSGILLASSAADNKLVPVNFDKSQIPSYLPVREPAITQEQQEEMKERISRIHSVRKMLAGEDWQYIELFNFEKGISYGYAGEDWYLYVDGDGNIHEELIDIDKRAIKELEVIMQLMRQTEKEESYARLS